MRARIALTLALVAAAGSAQLTLIPPAVPTGFAVDILQESFLEPTGLAFLPDGRILVIEQRTGAVKVWAGGPTTGTLGIVPGVNSNAYERGLLAIAVDPQWPNRPYIYLWYDSQGSQNMRLAMFTVQGALTAPASTNLTLGAQYDILTDVPDQAAIHNGGALRFAADGTLYLSIGDDGNPCAAQDINSGLGCIIRMSVASLPGPGTGPPLKATLIPPGNPFSGPTDNARLVWCYGLRNPFRFHLDPATGSVIIAEVGAWLVDEIDVSTAGGENFGWPWYEATLVGQTCTGTAPQAVHPVVSLNHVSLLASTTAIMSAGSYHNAPNGVHNLGTAYEGDYFYSEYFTGLLRRLRFNGTTWVQAPPVPGQPGALDWGRGFQTVVDTAVGPDGALYFVRQYSSHAFGALGRVRSDPAATQISIVSGNHQAGNAGLPLAHPFVVRVTDAAGLPLGGATVTWVPGIGGGSLSTLTSTTDVHGFASTTYTLAQGYTQPPIIGASLSPTSFVAFDVVWRGLTVAYAGALGGLNIEVRHSEPNAPFLLAWTTPPAPAPLATTPYGDIWVDVSSPATLLGFGDGLGLFGPPDPAFRTGSSSPNWQVSAIPPAMAGATVVFQAFAIDSTLAPAPESIMISNRQVVTLP